MHPSAPVVLAMMVSVACASSARPVVAQTMSPSEITLAPGESRRVPESEVVITFETVAEDSRCPTGVQCVWEGDAAVRLRVEGGETPAATYTLHTNHRFEGEAAHGTIRIRLVAVTPHPAVDAPVKAEDYRVTLGVDRQ